MNKQELIKHYEDMSEKLHVFPVVAISRILEDLRQLAEPQKVVVPQFVADWYEKNKDEFELNLWVFLTDFDEENIDMSERFGIWLGDEDNNPIQTLVNMHQFGYEVEKEPKYTVKIKSTKCSTTSLVFSESTGAWFFSVTTYQGVRFKHTRKELEEAGFGWVFDCEGVEVEEVKE